MNPREKGKGLGERKGTPGNYRLEGGVQGLSHLDESPVLGTICLRGPLHDTEVCAGLAHQLSNRSLPVSTLIEIEIKHLAVCFPHILERGVAISIKDLRLLPVSAGSRLRCFAYSYLRI